MDPDHPLAAEPAEFRCGSNLTDAEWAIVHSFLSAEAGNGGKRARPTREIVNAIFYFLRGAAAAGLALELAVHATELRR